MQYIMNLIAWSNHCEIDYLNLNSILICKPVLLKYNNNLDFLIMFLFIYHLIIFLLEIYLIKIYGKN